ncbi:virulence protein [Rhizobium rhizogenes]|uniref:virulence protein n=1 Tax=Rhizobium rhizogenes TaxID=359 RepID=UPI0022B6EF44|nr:virulence protein [Rhizobium rhizogenes]MCZ7448246.1 virulence protein [Rhizobium rhizogenes]MCZ7465907.1 virulence protein [Rhizobium rhizogenes]
MHSEESTRRIAGIGTGRPVRLPEEIFGEVAKRLITEDFVESANNMTRLKLAGHSAKDAVEKSEAGTFHTRINRLGNTSKALFEAAIPSEGFSANPDLRQGAATATLRAFAIAPTLPFQTRTRKTALVDRILDLPNAGKQLAAISAITKHLQVLAPEDRDRLIDRAIFHFEREGAQGSVRNYAARILATNHSTLSSELRTRVLNARNSNPELAAAYATAEEVARFLETQPAPTVYRSDRSADENIEIIQRETASCLGNAALSSKQRMEKIESIANATTEASEKSRAELMSATRPRRQYDAGR